jgi:hypothetical protein
MNLKGQTSGGGGSHRSGSGSAGTSSSRPRNSGTSGTTTKKNYSILIGFAVTFSMFKETFSTSIVYSVKLTLK